MTEESLFDQARHRPPAERAEFLAEACGGDDALRRRVEALLAAHDDPGGLPADPAPGPVTADDPSGPADDAAGATVGPYKLLQLIGEGGMGAVWLAEQATPVRRRVAVKLIRPDLDSARVVARFEAERQALALMDHPNIAKVLDAGTTDAGRPYFVMELVKGVPITKYCDDHRLTPRQRLELFVPVCQAVQHAHQKGVIHRDIKPSNVLVGLYDGRPVPKVIDFGVAKAAGPRLTDKTLFTEFGAVIGTLEYMAPEQAELDNVDVDTRADLYALGVLLYELLTGTTPFDGKRLRAAALAEVLRIIREEEPPTPSTRLSTAAELPTIAARRGLEPRRLSGAVRGELDWIVMKCLEKDRGRRYETANGLAMDLQRFLADEPVAARPTSAAYRVRKFLRRNKGPVLAAAVVVVALVAGIVGTSVGLVRANEARAAEAARADGEKQAKELAERRLTELRNSSDVLESVFDDLDPRRAEAEGKPLRAVLGERLIGAAARLDAAAVGDPLTVARLRGVLAKALIGLGYSAEAIPPLTQARRTREELLGPEHLATLISLNNLALAYKEAGRLDEALPLFEIGLARRTAAFGADHAETLHAMNNLAAALQTAGRTDKAVPLFERALAGQRANLGPDHRDTLTTLSNLAMTYQKAGRAADALPLLEQALATRRRVLVLNHPDTLTSLHNLATAYKDAGRLAEAIPLYEQALAGRREKLGPDQSQTVMTESYLAETYLAAGQADKAAALFERTHARRRDTLGADHPETEKSASDLGVAYSKAGRADKAVPLLEQVLARRRDRIGADDPETVRAVNNLAMAYWFQKRLDRSIPLFEEVLAKQKAIRGQHHPDTLLAMANLGINYRDAGRLADAVPLLEAAYRDGGQQPDLIFVARELYVTYTKAGRAADAAALTPGLLTDARRRYPADSLQLAGVLAAHGLSLMQAKNFAAAEPVLRECLVIRERRDPDGWPTFSARSLLGACLTGRQKYAEAEPLLLQGYEGLKARPAGTPEEARKRGADAAGRLVELYDAWGQKDKADEWRRLFPPAAKNVAP